MKIKLPAQLLTVPMHVTHFACFVTLMYPVSCSLCPFSPADDSCMGVDCHADAVCDPIRGCLCKTGFQGNGVSCEGTYFI